MSETYTIQPESKNCIYEEGHYCKRLTTGKKATIIYTRNGVVIIDTLTEEEKEEVLKSDDVLLNPYDTLYRNVRRLV